MPRTGRKPKPKAIHEQNGTLRPDRQNTNPLRFDPVSPEPPPWADFEIGNYARAFWDRVAPLLLGSKVLTEGDVEGLVLICHRYQDWREAHDTTVLEGITVATAGGGLMNHPAVNQKVKAWNDVMKWIGDYGLTPVARQRIQAPQAQAEDDEFLKLLDGSKR